MQKFYHRPGRGQTGNSKLGMKHEARLRPDLANAQDPIQL